MDVELNFLVWCLWFQRRLRPRAFPHFTPQHPRWPSAYPCHRRKINLRWQSIRGIPILNSRMNSGCWEPSLFGFTLGFELDASNLASHSNQHGTEDMEHGAEDIIMDASDPPLVQLAQLVQRQMKYPLFTFQRLFDLVFSSAVFFNRLRPIK